MATERQVNANRLNAKKSTGPQSADGKMRSSLNARKHGLSVPSSSGEFIRSAKQLATKIALVTGHHPSVYFDFARAKLECDRIWETVERISADEGMHHDPIAIKNLIAISRYERRSGNKMRVAAPSSKD